MSETTDGDKGRDDPARNTHLYVTGADGREREITPSWDGQITGWKNVGDAAGGETIPVTWGGEIEVEVTPEAAAWLRYVLVVRRMLYEPLEYRAN